MAQTLMLFWSSSKIQEFKQAHLVMPEIHANSSQNQKACFLPVPALTNNVTNEKYIEKWYSLKIWAILATQIYAAVNRVKGVLEVLTGIANILDVDIKELIVSTKK